MSAFYNLHPPLPAHDAMPDKKKLVNFNLRWIFEICRWKKIKKYFLTDVRFELASVPAPTPHSPVNEKVGFWVKVTFWFWLMYLLPPESEKKF